MKTLEIDNTQLSLDKKTTYLSSDTAANSATLSVDSILGFTNNIILIGEWGSENTEIIIVSSTTGTTMTLASNTLRDHQRGDKITLLDYNQIEISWESTTTPDSDTVLATIAIQADQTKSIYNDSVKTSGYYFVRFKDTINTLYSGYSNAIPYSGYADNSVFMIKKRALNELGEKIGDLITNEFLNEALNVGRRELDNDPRVLKWSFRQKFDQDVGNVLPGMWKITVPADLKDKNTNKNIMGLRIGKDGSELEHQTWRHFKENYRDIAHTTLNGVVADTDVSIILTASGDFDESGSIYVGAVAVTETLDAVAYTGNSEATNTLTGVTGIQTGGHTTGQEVWQNATFGLPTYYSIHDGYVYFDVPLSDDYAGENIYMDYFSTIVAITDDATEIDEPEYDMFVSYLKYRIKSLKANGKLDRDKDPDWIDWSDRKMNLINKEVSGQDIYLIPS